MRRCSTAARLIALSAEDRQRLSALIAPHTEGSFQVQLSGKSYRAVYRQIRDTEMKTLLLSDDVSLAAFRQSFLLISLSILLLFIVLLFPLILLFSRTLTRPLKNLSKSMQHYAAGHEDVRIHFLYNDEIGQLGRVFNDMVSERKRLTEEAYVLKLHEKESELRALQAQIHPHFFYNIINLVYWKAMRKGDEELAGIVHSIGRIFRMSLGQFQRMVPLEQEVELILEFLKLEKLRYGDRLAFTLSFPDALLDVRIPKLTIQPLIENAVAHGLGKNTGAIHIHASAALTEARDAVILTVRDDGCGIDPDTLALLPDRLPPRENGNSNRCALRNIHERILLLYGEAGSLSIQSVLGEGTTVAVRIPLDQLEKEAVQDDSDADSGR